MDKDSFLWQVLAEMDGWRGNLSAQEVYNYIEGRDDSSCPYTVKELHTWLKGGEGNTINYYETGKADGKAQYDLDKRANAIRDGELLSWTAVDNLMQLDQALDNISQVQYACGFVEGYLIAQFVVPA